MSQEVAWIRPAERNETGIPVLNRDDRVVELAGPNSELPYMMPGPQRSSRRPRTRVLNPGDEGGPPAGELGSSWPRNRQYAYFEDGKIFEQGPIFAEDYSEMLRRDGKAQSMEQALTLPIMSLDFSIQPGKNDKGEADFVREVLEAERWDGGMETPLRTVIAQMTGGFLFRRAHFEKVFRVRDDGKVVFQKLAWRDPTTCYVARDARDASFQGFMQWTWLGMSFEKVLVPRNKALVYFHGTHRNPLYGISDLETAYHCYDSKQKLRFLWYAFLENQVTPRVIVWDRTGNQPNAKSAGSKIANLRGGGIAAVASNWDSNGKPDLEIEYFEPKSAGQAAAEFKAGIDYLDSEMSGSILAGFLDLTGAAARLGRGSMALSQDQSAFFLRARQASANEVETCVTGDAIYDLVRYNFPPRSGQMPRLSLGSVSEGQAVQEAITFLQAVASAPEQPGTTPILPDEFIGLLTERVAGYFNLDVGAVHKALVDPEWQRRRSAVLPPGMTPEQAAAHGVINRAVGAVKAGDLRGANGGGNGAVPAAAGAGRFIPSDRSPGVAGEYPG